MADEYRLKFITEWDSNHAKASKDMQNAIHQVSNATKDLQKDANNTGNALKEMLQQAAAFGGLSLGAAGIKAFATEMINVRKEMQSLNTSFRVLLGNQQAADKMFKEIKQFAATTPLMMNDLASSAQTMLGFGIEAEKVMPTLKAIGDISMGNGEKLKSLSLAFSQMSATGKLMGQDLLQMINAGFNPLEVMSKKTGKSIGTLKEEMSKGAISAEMVAEAFMAATQEGGKFYGMLEQRGKDLDGQLNTLSGAITDMFNELGESSEGAIATAVSGVTTLVQNYETVGRAITSLIATYGTYRAAVIVTNTIEATRVLGLIDGIKYISMNTIATKAATAAQAAFNVVAKANPYVLLATAIIAVGTAMWTFAKNVDEAQTMQSKFNNEREKFSKSLKDEKDETENLLKIIQDANSTDAQRVLAYEQLKKKCSELTDKYSLEEIQVLKLADAYKVLNGAQEERTMDYLQKQIDIRQKALDQIEKKQKRSSDVQAFMNANGMTHQDVNKVKEQLKQQIADLKGELDPMKDAKDKANKNSNKKYKEEAAAALKDWKDAKREYEKLKNSKDATTKEVKEAQSKMEAADKKYEEITGKKASAESKSGTKSAKDAAKDAERVKELKEKQLKEEVRAHRKLLTDTAQAEIDAMATSNDKTLAQIDLNYQKQLNSILEWFEDIKQQKIDAARELWKAENPNATTTFDESSVDTNYTQEELNARDAMVKAAVAAHEREVEENHRIDEQYRLEYLAAYGDFEQQKMAIAEQYAKKIAEAEFDWQKEAMKRQQEEDSKKLEGDEAMKQIKNSSVYLQAMIDPNSIDDKALEGFRKQLDEARKSIAGMDPENLRVIADLMKEVDEVLVDRNPFQSWKEGLEELTAASEQTRQAQIDLAEAQGNVQKATAKVKMAKDAKERKKAELEVADAVSKANKAQVKYNDAMARQMAADQKVKNSKMAVANNVTAVGDSIVKAANVAGMFDKNVGDFISGIGSLVSAVGTAVKVTSESTTSSIKAIESASVILAVIAAAVQLAMMVANLFNDDDKKQEQIENIGKSINRLKNAYQDLEVAVNKTYARQRQNNIEKEISNLTQQNALIRQQIELEKSKKDSDDNAISQYEDAINENIRKIRELREAAVDAIFGEDINSAIENFADAYSDAWMQNTNRTKTAKEQVREMMQNMVKESIKAFIQASGEMEKIRNKMASYFTDGVFSAEEEKALYRDAEALQKKLDLQFGWSDRLFDENNDFTQNASAGGFTAMSQESADELNGRFAASQMTLITISDAAVAIAVQAGEFLARLSSISAITTEQNAAVQEIRNMMISVNSNIEDIAIYTKSLTTFGAKFDEMNRKLEKL